MIRSSQPKSQRPAANSTPHVEQATSSPTEDGRRDPGRSEAVISGRRSVVRAADITRVIRACEKGGMKVGSVSIFPTGHCVLERDRPSDLHGSSKNEWDDIL